MDDMRRIALVETLTVENSSPVTETPVLRYQLGNNIESATLELDENANIISYEEYYPYGDTSYQAGRSASEVSQKRYRYTGKEKDDESGFYYHGARYYACWLGRWTAVDPAGLVDGLNLYMYCRGNPVMLLDPSGNEGVGIDDVISNRHKPEPLKIKCDPSKTGNGIEFNLQKELGSAVATDKTAVNNQIPVNATTSYISPSQATASDESILLKQSGNVSKGIAVPKRYGLYEIKNPEKNPSVAGIVDMKDAKIRNGKRVGEPVIRVEKPHLNIKDANFPHINVNVKDPKTGLPAPDPHKKISPTTLKTLGGGAKVLGGLQKVSRPLAIVTDGARIATAMDEDKGIGENTKQAAVNIAGGWAGAYAGAFAGAKLGATGGAAVGGLSTGPFAPAGVSAGAIVGAFLGGIVGGIGGAMGGSYLSEKGYKSIKK
jgi:RHS repeat-associated protein